MRHYDSESLRALAVLRMQDEEYEQAFYEACAYIREDAEALEEE
jgi:hypothetical protein